MIEAQKIPSFIQGNTIIRDLWVLSTSSHSLIICPSVGTTLAVDQTIFQSLLQQSIDEPLAFLLVQRGMAVCEGSRPISELQDKVMPSFFLIDVTKSCNLRCTYCFRELNHLDAKMSNYRLSSICDWLIAYCKRTNLSCPSIQIWGGEPLLETEKVLYVRKRFDEEQLNPQIVIETNATLITENTAHLLYKNRIDVGVSVDGPAFIHNSQRPYLDGKPSLPSVKRGIANLRNAGFTQLGSITVVTHKTLAHLSETIEYLTVGLGLSSIKLNLMRKTDSNKGLAVELSEIGSYVERLLACLEICFDRKVSVVEHNVSQRIANLLSRPCNNVCNACGCHGGYRMLSIDSNGDVFPCELTDDQYYNLGNISNAFPEIMVNKAIEGDHVYFAERDTQECLECPWWFYCRGGCRSASKYSCGDPRRIDKTECTLNRELYPRLVEILLEMPSFGRFLHEGIIE